jgi:hypothetical protein
VRDGDSTGALIDLDADLVPAGVQPGGFDDVGGGALVVAGGDDDLTVLPAGFGDDGQVQRLGCGCGEDRAGLLGADGTAIGVRIADRRLHRSRRSKLTGAQRGYRAFTGRLRDCGAADSSGTR